MSTEYSIKKYLQQKSKNTIDPCDIQLMGREIEMESKKRYSEKGALNIISRYIDVVDGKVVFDFVNRDQSRNYSALSQKIERTISQKDCLEATDIHVHQIEEKSRVVKKEDIPKEKTKRSTQKDDHLKMLSVARSGMKPNPMPSISNNTIENELSPHEEIDMIAPKKEKASEKKKTPVKKEKMSEKKKTLVKKELISTEPSKPSVNAASMFGKKTAPVESNNQTVSMFGKKTVTVGSNNQTVSMFGKNTAPVESNNQTVSMFGKKTVTVGSNNQTVSMFGKKTAPVESNNQTVSMFGKKTATVGSNNQTASMFGKKTAPVESNNQTVSMFGKKKAPVESNVKVVSMFGKKLENVESNNQVDEYLEESLVNVENELEEYKLPVEPSHKKLYRTGYQYEPYGTDNYHDDCIVNDSIGKNELRRTNIFDELSSREYPAQRSPEWFRWRDQMLTASDGGTAIGVNPYEQPYELVLKKVFGKPFITSIDCYHGKKYEMVATSIFGYRMNVVVEEFGLCQHPKYKFLGASPDGIVSHYKLNRKDMRRLTRFIGRMLEIKCPMRRHILMDRNAPIVYGVHGEPIRNLKYDVKKGICPTYYWVQVQLQLQCCELDECDFWQCEISEYIDRDEFLDDTDMDYPWISNSTKHEKGAVIQLMPIERLAEPLMSHDQRIWNFAEFIYQPRIDMSPYEIDQWIVETMVGLATTHVGRMVERILYWKVNKTRNTTIPRDDDWFNNNLNKFSDIWKLVEYFRNNKDRAELLNLYICSLNKKTNAHIFETMNRMADQPTKTDTTYTEYVKYIEQLEKFVKDNFNEHVEEDTSVNDISCVREVLDREVPSDPKEQHKFRDLLQKLRLHAEQFLSGDPKKDNDDEDDDLL